MTKEMYAERKKLTFEQAEGITPIPSQLQLKEISRGLRGLLWKVVYESLQENTKRDSIGGYTYFRDEWRSILYLNHVLRDQLMADEFDNDPSAIIPKLKRIFTHGDYTQIFGFLQFVLRHPNCPHGFGELINMYLEYGKAAYRVLDEDTIIPIASEAERITLERTFADLSTTEFRGARTHLANAGEQLTAGEYANSIRESIHAVESVARILAPSGSLKDALAQLEKSSGIHGGLKAGFNSIYGYTSDEKGLRHPLLDDSQAKVDEVDALFMIGACAAFVSYMIQKARIAGLLKK